MEQDTYIARLKTHEPIPDSHLFHFKQWTLMKVLLIITFTMTVSTIELIAKTTSLCLHIAAHPNGKVCVFHSALSSLCSEGWLIYSYGIEGPFLRSQLASTRRDDEVNLFLMQGSKDPYI